MQQYRKNLGKVSLTAEGSWNLNNSYDILSIVYDEHTQHGFISRKAVPQGVDLYNKEYWMPLNVSGYADNNVIILSKKTSEASIQSYTLEEAITSIKSVGRRPGAILGFYNENNDRLDIGGRWELWQFNDTNVYNWENVDSWQNLYYNYNKFMGWFKDENFLTKYAPFPEIGCYAFVGSEFNEATVYRCDNKYVWNNTTQHAWDYVKVIVDGNVTVGENGNWFNNGEDTGIPASVKGENGKSPIFREKDNIIQYSFDNVNWITISDKVAAWFRWNATTGDTQTNNVGRIQISRDNVTWTNLSGDIINNLHISRYIGVNETLPTNGIAEGTIYAKGPTYADEDTSRANPIYRLWVYAWKDDTLAWQDNGEFTSIAAGVVQEIGDSETEVMSQKAVSEKLSELGSKGILDIVGEPSVFFGLENVILDARINFGGYDKIAIEYILKNYTYNSVVYNSINITLYNNGNATSSIVSSKNGGVDVELLNFSIGDANGSILIDWSKVKEGKTELENKVLFSYYTSVYHYGYIDIFNELGELKFYSIEKFFEGALLTINDCSKINNAILDCRVSKGDYDVVGIEYILKNAKIGNVIYNSINIFASNSEGRVAYSFPSKTNGQGVELFRFSTEGLNGVILIDWDKIKEGSNSFDERLVFSSFSASEHYGYIDIYEKTNKNNLFKDVTIDKKHEELFNNFFCDAIIQLNKGQSCGVNNVIKNSTVGGKLYNSISLFVKNQNVYTDGVFESKTGGVGIELMTIEWLDNSFKIVVNWDAISDGIRAFDTRVEFSDYLLMNHYGAVLVLEEIEEAKKLSKDPIELFYIKGNKLICNNAYKQPSSNTVAKYLKVDMKNDVKKVMAKFTTLGGDLALISTNLDTSQKVYDIVRRSVHIVFGTNSVAYGCYWGGTWTRNTVTYEPLVTDDVTEYEVGYEIIDDTNLKLYLPNGETTTVECDRLSDCNGQYVIFESYTYNDTKVETTENFARVGITGIYCETFDENTLVLKDNFKRQDGSVSVSPTGHVYSLFRNSSENDSIYDNC